MSDMSTEDIAATVRARPEFGAQPDWILYACSVGGRTIAGIHPKPTGMDFIDAARLADPLADELEDTMVEGRRPLWASLRVTSTAVEQHWGVDEPIPAWMPMDSDFDLQLPVLWLIQWFAFDKRPPSQLPSFWKDKLATLGAWDDKRDDIAIDEYHNPLHGPKLFDRRGHVLK